MGKRTDFNFTVPTLPRGVYLGVVKPTCDRLKITQWHLVIVALRALVSLVERDGEGALERLVEEVKRTYPDPWSTGTR